MIKSLITVAIAILSIVGYGYDVDQRVDIYAYRVENGDLVQIENSSSPYFDLTVAKRSATGRPSQQFNVIAFPDSGMTVDRWSVGYTTWAWTDRWTGTPESVAGATNSIVWTFNERDAFARLVVDFRYLRYNIHYVYPSGGGDVADVTAQRFDQPVTLAGAVSKPGYSFEGWTNSVGTAYSALSSVDGSVLNVTNDDQTVNLYAAFSPAQLEVTFDGNGGGTPTPATKSVTYDSVYGELATCLRTGYSFIGWYTAVSGGSSVKADSRVTITAPQTLYAHWTNNWYLVHFEFNGGSHSSVTNELMKFDEKYRLITPNRTGYTFAYWSLDEQGAQRVDENTKVQRAAEHTLYAQWLANSYTLSFDANGGTPTPAPRSVTYDQPFGELPQVTRENFAFVGWYTEREGGEEITPEDRMSVAGNLKLWAHWSDMEFTVVFDGAVAYGEMEPTNVKYAVEFALPENRFFRDRYWVFSGWTDTVNRVAYADGAVVSNLATSGEVELRAIWEKVEPQPPKELVWRIESSGNDTCTVETNGAGVVTVEAGMNPTLSGPMCMKMVVGEVDGSGTLSFDFRGNYMAQSVKVELDDETLTNLVCQLEYRRLAALKVSGSGKLKLSFFGTENFDDGRGGEFSLSNLVWIADGAETGTTWVEAPGYGVLPVSDSWIRDSGIGEEELRDNLGGSAHKPGWDVMYWQEYIAGTNPRDPLSVFRFTCIGFDELGQPVLEWSPHLADREYRVFGKAKLTDADWTYPAPPASRFFQATVDIPKPDGE